MNGAYDGWGLLQNEGGLTRPADDADLDLALDFLPPFLMPPWSKLQKLGKSAMDGAFSPFATGCRVGATLLLQLRPRLARRAASSGCISLVTFFVQAKKVTRPYQSCFVRSRNLETGETMPPHLNG
jgi:hypothetical protein